MLIRYVRRALLLPNNLLTKPHLFGKMSVDNPDPPESLPAYITDGVSKQDTESLLELQKTCHLYPLIVELGLEGMNITEVTDQSETEDK